MDFTDIRVTTLELHGIVKANKEYKFYYDETNNPRLFKITEKGFNFDENAFFVLGGIVFDKGNTPTEEDIVYLYKELQVQSSMKEVKFSHIQQKAKDFLSLVRKPRVKKLIDWLFKNNLWIHYSYRDNFYYSIVDIVDSLEETAYLGRDFQREIKSDLYLNMRKDKDLILDIFRNNNYPNVVDTQRFVMDILKWIEEVKEDDNFNLEYLRESIKNHKMTDLDLLNERDPLVTIDNYSDIYLNRVLVFFYSQHTFDEEKQIEELIDKDIIIEGQTIKSNHVFINSILSKYVQISDLVVGIIRMWLSYLVNSDSEQMEIEFSQLTNDQAETLRKFNAIMDSSIKENFAFKHGSGSNEFEQKISFFLNYTFRT